MSGPSFDPSCVVRSNIFIYREVRRLPSPGVLVLSIIIAACNLTVGPQDVRDAIHLKALDCL